jgi:hypothetical protein
MPKVLSGDKLDIKTWKLPPVLSSQHLEAASESDAYAVDHWLSIPVF